MIGEYQSGSERSEFHDALADEIHKLATDKLKAYKARYLSFSALKLLVENSQSAGDLKAFQDQDISAFLDTIRDAVLRGGLGLPKGYTFMNWQNDR